MPYASPQEFLQELDKKLWIAADHRHQLCIGNTTMGFGGFVALSKHLIEEDRCRECNLSLGGQGSNPTVSGLGAMNMGIPSIIFNFSKEPANFFTSDQRADY